MFKTAALGMVFGLAGLLFAVTAQANDIVRVGDGPFLTGGGYFIARDKGYFDKLGITIEAKHYIDGAMAVPSMLSNELDITNLSAAASLFNSIAKGAPLVVIMDWGQNKPGRAYTTTNVTPELYDQGVRSLADFAKLKGKRVGVAAPGAINQYNIARGLEKAGLDPVRDVQWITNVSQPDLMKMLGQKQVDVTDLAYQFGYFAQQNKWGPMISTGDEVAPGGEIASWVARREFIEKHRDVAVRFAIAYLQGVKEFNAAAADPSAHEDVVAILAKNTALDKPELVKAIAPHWGYINEDGAPPVQSIMEMQDFWSDKFKLVQKKVTQEQLFDLSIAKEAKTRLDREQPFGK